MRQLGSDLKRTRREIDGLRRLFTGADGLSSQLQHVEQIAEALLRREAVDAASLPFPERLVVRRFHLRSQGGEDGLVQALLQETGIGPRRFVELGCGWNGGNSGFLVEELGWTGLLVDSDREIVDALRRRWRPTDVDVKQLWITSEDVDDHLMRWGYDGEVDLLSIDVDGNDLWIWRAVTVCHPRVVAIEYNSAFGAKRSVAVPYDPAFSRDKDVVAGLYYGASLGALVREGARKGYRLVATTNVNAFFVREGLAEDVPAVSAQRAWRLYPKDDRRLLAVDDDPFGAFAEAGLDVVEIE